MGAALDVEGIRSQLAGSIWHELIYVPVVDSTNQVIAELVASRPLSPLAVLTDFQTAGRGRLSRAWVAPPETSVLLSVALPLPAAALATDATAAAALAVADTIGDLPGIDASLKWPNDVLVGEKKVCGILSQLTGEWVIAGIGINGNFDPSGVPGLGGTATSLECELGRSVDRSALVAGLLKSIELWYRCLADDPASVFEVWSGRLGIIGSVVQVIDAADTWQGVVQDVQRDGGLVVRQGEDPARTIYAADVSIR